MWITKHWQRIKTFFLNLFFPKFCFSCQREGNYLCQDCESALEILEYQYCLCKDAILVPKVGKCKKCSQKKLNGLYFAAPYQNHLIQKLIHYFKYEPFIKELGETLASLIITHFQLAETPPPFFGGGSDFLLVPVPLEQKRIKWRGFNQAEEIGKELSRFLKIPLIADAIVKIKTTPPQVQLSDKEREENIKGAYLK